MPAACSGGRWPASCTSSRADRFRWAAAAFCSAAGKRAIGRRPQKLVTEWFPARERGAGLGDFQQRRVRRFGDFHAHHRLDRALLGLAKRLHPHGPARPRLAGGVVVDVYRAGEHRGGSAQAARAGPAIALHAVRSVLHALEGVHGPRVVFFRVLVPQVSRRRASLQPAGYRLEGLDPVFLRRAGQHRRRCAHRKPDSRGRRRSRRAEGEHGGIRHAHAEHHSRHPHPHRLFGDCA